MTAVRCSYVPGCRRRVVQIVEVTYPGAAGPTSSGYCARHWPETGLDRPVLSRTSSARAEEVARAHPR